MKKAFSLTEISIVILIIGLVVATIGQGSDLIAKYRITAAQKMTRASKVSSTPGLVLWYETSLDDSFSKANRVDGATVSQWNDVNPQGSVKLNALAGQKTDSSKITYNVATGGTSGNTSGPTYVLNGINSLPTLRFTNNNTSAYRYLAVDKGMSNDSTDSLTLFVVMRYRGGDGSPISRIPNIDGAPVNPVSLAPLGGQPLFSMSIAADGSLNPFIRSNTTDFPDIGGSSSWDVGYDLSPEASYVITMQRDYGRSFTVYVNGNSTYAGGTPSKADNGLPITLDPYKIGRSHRGDSETIDTDISEFILISGDMKVAAREEIEDYLGKKYNIKVTH